MARDAQADEQFIRNSRIGRALVGILNNHRQTTFTVIECRFEVQVIRNIPSIVVRPPTGEPETWTRGQVELLLQQVTPAEDAFLADIQQ